MTDNVSLAFAIFFGFNLILYFLSKVLSSAVLYRYASIELKEGLIILFFYLIALALYYFIYKATIYDNIFQTGYSGSIYNFSYIYAERLYNLSNEMMLRFTNIEGAIYQFSTFSCSGACYDSLLICTTVPPNKRSLDFGFARTEYAEPFFNSLANARYTLSTTIKTISSYYSLLRFQDIYFKLLFYGIILRLLPGMKYVGNILFVIALVFLIVMPLLLFLQGMALHDYLKDISTRLEQINKVSYFGEAGIIVDIIPLQIRVIGACIANAACDPCNEIFSPPRIEYIPSIPDLKITLEYKDITYEYYESRIRELYQGMFIISVFVLSATLVGMIATARVVLSLLGDRFSFVDLFLRVV